MKVTAQARKKNQPVDGTGMITREGVVVLQERLRRKAARADLDDDSESRVTLFSNIPFLLLFSLTVMNAFLYVYLAANDFPAIDERNAAALARQTFGPDYTYFSPIYEFLGETRTAGDSEELSFPEFKKSLSKLKENISSLGIPAGRMFARQSFHFSRGGIYWTPPLIEGPTSFIPKIPDQDPPSGSFRE